MAEAGRLAALAHPHAPDTHEEDLRALQLALARLQVAYHRQGLAAVILLEGWDAAGKGGLIKRLTAELDPRYVKVFPIGAPQGPERAEHYLQRFWRAMPARGTWSIFDRSWYGRVLVERVEGFATPADWRRAYGEINAMEATLADAGIRLVKLFLHTSQEEQDKRLVDRLEQPWKRWKVSAEDFRNRARRPDYLLAMEEMFDRCSTPHAPWHLIGADHKKHARLAGLRLIHDRLAEGVDLAEPSLDPELRALAERALDRPIHPK